MSCDRFTHAYKVEPYHKIPLRLIIYSAKRTLMLYCSPRRFPRLATRSGEL